MHSPPDILSLAYKQPFMHEELHLMQEKERQIPGSVRYVIRRYKKNPQWNMEDLGMMTYHYKKGEPANNYFELRFCVAGNTYCKQKDRECDSCRLNAVHCGDRVETVDVLSFQFTPAHLSQFVKPEQVNSSVADEILRFNHPSSFFKNPFPLRPHPEHHRIAAESSLYG